MHYSARWSNRVAGVSKRKLGVHYLVGTGAVLSGLIAVRILIGAVPTAVVVGLLPSIALASVVYWLPREGLDEDGVWRIAEWSGLGIGLLTLAVVGLLALPIGDRRTAVVLSSNVALGGLVGALLGAVRVHNERVRSLREKHSVLARVLRHDLRNAMALVRGHAESLEDAVPEGEVEHVREIERTADELVALSEDARRLQRTLDPDHEVEPVDVAAVLRERVERLRAAHPDARIETDLSAEAWVYADEFLASVVDDLLENAVEHNDGSPRVWVSVSSSPAGAPDGVLVRIADDGPGIPEREMAVLDGGGETPLEHSAGTGLWLVRWLVERYGGEIDFERGDDGTLVRVLLPGAPPA